MLQCGDIALGEWRHIIQFQSFTTHRGINLQMIPARYLYTVGPTQGKACRSDTIEEKLMFSQMATLYLLFHKLRGSAQLNVWLLLYFNM